MRAGSNVFARLYLDREHINSMINEWRQLKYNAVQFVLCMCTVAVFHVEN